MHPELLEMGRQRALTATPTVATEGLLMLAGAYAAISPWVIGFASMVPGFAANNLILGALLALIGLGVTGTPERSGGISWAAVPIGVWLIITPWVVQAGTPTAGLIISNVVIGAVVVVLGLAVAGLVVTTKSRQTQEVT